MQLLKEVLVLENVGKKFSQLKMKSIIKKTFPFFFRRAKTINWLTTFHTSFLHKKKKTDKQIFNSYRYDTILSTVILWGPTQIGSRRKMWPHSDGLIWHLLLQTESVGPRGRQKMRDRGVIESSSLDLIGKWDERGLSLGECPKQSPCIWSWNHGEWRNARSCCIYTTSVVSFKKYKLTI